MNVQIIKSVQGKPEYALLPISIYLLLREKIDKALEHIQPGEEYVPFELQDYVDNPVALLRIQAHITQEALAKLMGVSQAYISKIEQQATVTPTLLEKVRVALDKKKG